MTSKRKAVAIIIGLVIMLVLGLVVFVYVIGNVLAMPAATIPVAVAPGVTTPTVVPPATSPDIMTPNIALPDTTYTTTPPAVTTAYPETKPYDPYPFIPIFAMEPLPEDIIQFIRGSSFHYEAPFDYSFLTFLTITFVDFYGQYRYGNMIVAYEIGPEVLEIFGEIFAYRFPIYGMRLIDYYYARDYYSMKANNTVGFNFRTIAGTSRLSRHAFGKAIDINPIQNPYIRGDTVWPAAGRYYMDRENIRPGMIVPGDVVYRAFISRGWTWGGNWRTPRDYHHFER